MMKIPFLFSKKSNNENRLKWKNPNVYEKSEKMKLKPPN